MNSKLLHLIVSWIKLTLIFVLNNHDHIEFLGSPLNVILCIAFVLSRYILTRRGSPVGGKPSPIALKFFAKFVNQATEMIL